MVSTKQARRLALALPGATEQDHHGRPSFRVGGKIFSTLWTERQMNVMLDHDGILTAVQAHPDLCEEVWWGKRLAAGRGALHRADASLGGEVLAGGGGDKAPARRVRGAPA